MDQSATIYGVHVTRDSHVGAMLALSSKLPWASALARDISKEHGVRSAEVTSWIDTQLGTRKAVELWIGGVRDPRVNWSTDPAKSMHLQDAHRLQ